MKVGKVWGTTELIIATPLFEQHLLEIKAGGYSSKHGHRTKINGFLVTSGTLLIRVWRSPLGPDETILKAGQATRVEPGIRHQFEALEPCVCVETYWAEYTPDDIERDDIGGMR